LLICRTRIPKGSESHPLEDYIEDFIRNKIQTIRKRVDGIIPPYDYSVRGTLSSEEYKEIELVVLCNIKLLAHQHRRNQQYKYANASVPTVQGPSNVDCVMNNDSCN